MYFDPGIGSMIIQMVIAAIAAVGVVWGVMKLRVKGWFQRKSGAEKQEDEDESL